MSNIEVNKVENEEENKTPDKKQIEAEEKEVMLKTDAENVVTVATDEKPKIEENEGPVKSALSTEFTEQGREVKPKFIPIGAIKMPGFFTRNSDKDKSKEEDTVENDAEEKTDEAAKPRHRLQFLHTCPFTQFLHHPHNDNENGAENPENPPRRIIRIPNLAALKPASLKVPKIFKRKPEKDPEAALASMETLEDKVETPNDGMENVKLDGDEVEGKVATKLPLKERIRQKKFIIDDIVVCALVLLVLLCVIVGIVVGARAGPPAQRPLRLGRYMTTITSCGPVEGILSEGVYKFYNIPYAAPPVGPRRFTYAQPLNNLSLCWDGVRPAHGPGPYCLQRLENDTFIGQEDCLTLDVLTPHVRASPHSISELSPDRAEPRRHRPWDRPPHRYGPRSELPKRYDSPLPVVVLIGADTLAGGVSPLQPSSLYARTKEVVFVRPNFRLGALGFLALDVLSRERYPPTSGNYALSDLLAALTWVRHNAQHFGGDPLSVTLLGHRAGATLAAALTTVRQARALYSRAWLSSPSVIFPGEPLEQAQKANEEFKLRSKCADVECLRRLSTTEVLSATPEAWLASDAGSLPGAGEPRRSWLVLDGELLRVHAYEAWDAQLKAKRLGKEKEFKPMVFGTTLHSGHSELLRRQHLEWTPEDVEATVGASAIAARNLTREVFQHFNRTYSGLAELISAVRTLCPLVSLARLRLGAPLYVASAGGSRLADAAADVQAVLGTFDSERSQQRRFMAAQQQLFYYFVWHGTLPAGADTGLISVDQDLLPLPALPACDLFIREDIVPRFAHVD